MFFVNCGRQGGTRNPMIITFLTIICWKNVSYGGGQIVLLRRFSLFLLSSCGHHGYTCIFLQLKLLAIFSQFIVLLVCLLTMEYQEIPAISNKGFDFVSQHILPPFPRSQDPTLPFIKPTNVSLIASLLLW